MIPFVLYCKSYKKDVKRVARLAKSIASFNVDQIPFYVSVPQSDLELFTSFLAGTPAILMSDESIIAHNTGIDMARLDAIPGHLSQQVVKSEFWRTGISTSYMCLDSDCVFIRPFHLSEFITPLGMPYTIIDEGRDLFFSVLARRDHHIIDNYRRESLEVQSKFGRNGKHYNFGPNCPIWDSRVWASLDQHYMRPKNQTFLDLVLESGNEQRWYGEALLKYRAIELLPSQPFFKMYHYAWQQKFDKKNGVTQDQLAHLYCGVVYQSAWEREMDWPHEAGSVLSRLARRIRRMMGRM